MGDRHTHTHTQTKPLLYLDNEQIFDYHYIILGRLQPNLDQTDLRKGENL